MTRAASNRKNGTGSAAASSRPGPVFRGRDVVFVDPLDDKESYWWPAMIVPVSEIDSSMDCIVLNPGECLVKYFEDNKYSVVPFTDLQPFVPTTIPFLEFELAAGQKFLKNGGVVNALAYLDSGKVKRKFSWNRWGTAQDQELSLDGHKHKAITLPMISDKAFAELQIQQQSHIGIFSSASSSPILSTKNDTDTENESKDALNTASGHISSTSASTSPSTPSMAQDRAKEEDSTTRQSGHQMLKNGLQRSLASVASSSEGQSTSTLLPSPVSLHDLATEPADETEFSLRPPKRSETVTKGSLTALAIGTTGAVGTGGRRSRRGSRDNENKITSTAAVPTSNNKESTKRSRNTSELSSSSVSSSATGLNNNTSGTAAVGSPSSSTSNAESPKKRKTTSEMSAMADLQSGVSESGSPSARSSRQGSAEPTVSPRSTRHSSRKASENNGSQAGQGEDTSEPSIEASGLTRLQTHRMTRQRSAPKSASSLPSAPVSSSSEKMTDNAVRADIDKSSQDVKGEKKQVAMTNGPNFDQKSLADTVEKMDDSATAMDIDTPEAEPKGSSQERAQSLSSIPASSIVSTSASLSSSPSSMGPEEGHMNEETLSISAANGNSLLQSLEQERRQMNHNFEHVLPTLAIGSKEREAFYEKCMDHLQRLRQEHRRLKEILKSSEYLPKGRRATRSSPQYHSGHHHSHRHHNHHNHHHHHHLEEKQNHRGRSSPAPLRNSSSSSNGGQGQANKENQQSNGSTAHKASSKSALAATAAAASVVEEGNLKEEAQTKIQESALAPVYQGSTPSSAILTSNISTTTRRSAATAAAAAVTATVSRSSRQSQNNTNNGHSKAGGMKGSKKRSHSATASQASSSSSTTSVSAAMAAEVEAAALAAVSEDGGGPITTRAKRRQR
ncbi:hypothetical protein BGX28_006816 [Mortierella sp. GBA30]|nr:hypothetical protein BGX28_006816 [Mortierella sp. GBA30]